VHRTDEDTACRIIGLVMRRLLCFGNLFQSPVTTVMDAVNNPSHPDFGQQPLVANGATDLLSQLYGDAGAHARSAVGLAALPNGACIEIEMILEIED
jgi:enamine deaminase RidA (YjgF/YER057c/UK114 family)